MNKNNKTVQTMTQKLLIGMSSLLLLLLASLSAHAAKQGHIEITSKVQKLVLVESANGESTYEFASAAKVVPGETVQYNTYFENISHEQADGIEVVNPIPEHTVYLPNTAQGVNSDIDFSTDGGQHYDKADVLTVRDHNGELHPAQPSDYTHIRWQYQGSLSPSEQQAVAFRVRLL